MGDPDDIPVGEFAARVAAEAESSPLILERVLAQLSRDNPELNLAGRLVRKPEDFLSPEEVAMLAKLADNKIPSRRDSFLVQVVNRLDSRLARDTADTIVDGLLSEQAQESRSRMVDGGDFVHDVPELPPTIWGKDKSVVWAEGESLMISGPPGVGKTTLAGQVVRGRLVGGEVLGMEVRKTESRVLYLAMDRPMQIARALFRHLGDVPRDVLNASFQVWQGPPLHDIAAHPDTMLAMARQAGADTVVVDSLKDAAIGLKEDEVGAGYNRARQLCLAHRVQLMELHHAVKRGESGPPNKLEDVYGSAWITAGAGSVVSLHGQAGDPIVAWKHLKQPMEEIGPFMLEHDHSAGTSVIYGAVDMADMARRAGPTGVTAQAMAAVVYEKTKPSPAEVAKCRRRLDALVRAGRLTVQPGNAGTKTQTVWFYAGDPENDFGPILDDLL